MTEVETPSKREILDSDLTPEKVKFIRKKYDNWDGENKDQLIKKCQAETYLTEFQIKTIMEAHANDYYSKSKGCQNSGTSRYKQLTQEMRDFLTELSAGLTGREKQKAFNEKFADSDITPLSRRPVLRYRSKILKEGD